MPLPKPPCRKSNRTGFNCVSGGFGVKIYIVRSPIGHRFIQQLFLNRFFQYRLNADGCELNVGLFWKGETLRCISGRKRQPAAHGKATLVDTIILFALSSPQPLGERKNPQTEGLEISFFSYRVPL